MSTDTIQSNATPEIYKVSIGRQVVLWITFLIFLPFFISMPIMMFMRIANGRITDTISLGAIFLVALVGVIFIVLQILAAGRQRIELNEDKITLKLPTWKGPTPLGPVVKADLNYSDVSAIEKRGELYALLGVLGLREVSSIITHDGKRYVLGYISENEADAPIPYDKITESLAQRTGKEVLHKGAVNGGTQVAAMFKGSPSWETTPLNAEDVIKIRKRAQNFTLALLVLFILLFAGSLGFALYPEIIELVSSGSGTTQ